MSGPGPAKQLLPLVCQRCAQKTPSPSLPGFGAAHQPVWTWRDEPGPLSQEPQELDLSKSQTRGWLHGDLLIKLLFPIASSYPPPTLHPQTSLLFLAAPGQAGPSMGFQMCTSTAQSPHCQTMVTPQIPRPFQKLLGDMQPLQQG